MSGLAPAGSSTCVLEPASAPSLARGNSEIVQSFLGEFRASDIASTPRTNPNGHNAAMPIDDTPLSGADTPPRARIGDYALAALGTGLAVLAGFVVEHWLGHADLSLIFMLAVLIVAARTRTGPAVLTAVLCFLAYNFFFIEPRYTFYIDAWQGVAQVSLFLAAALLAGRLASRLTMQVHALRIAHRHADARRDLAQRLATATDETTVLETANAMMRRHLDADVWLRPHEQTTSEPHALRRVGADDDSWRWAATAEEHGWWFLPLIASGRTLGTLGLKRRHEPQEPDEPWRALAREMADDIGAALARVRLVGDLQRERMANETERLRSALLSSVSHDLRTPLASIIGAAGSLESYGAAMDAADRSDLLDTIRSEGERLDRYVQNLLDMTRLGHGELSLHRDWIGVDELVGSAIARLQRYRPGARFDTAIDAALAPVWVHPALLEQALFNVIENAAKFSPPNEPIRVEAQRIGERVRIDVIDRGPGIREDERQRVFEMFYSTDPGQNDGDIDRPPSRSGDRGRGGTGLGLAICRGMVGAHGGEVQALPGDDGRGTRMRIEFPTIAPPDEDDA